MTAGLAQSKTGSSIPGPVRSAASNTVDRIIYEPDAELLRDMRSKVRIVQSKRDWVELDRESSLSNAARTRAAYTAKFPIQAGGKDTIEVVVVRDERSDLFFELRGIDDFPWRPFSGMTWISDDVLQFEQWVNPGNGGRYRVDLKSGTVVAAGYVRHR